MLGDVGQETFEELNYRPRELSAGTNFGWSAFEGNRRFNRRVRARRRRCADPHVRPRPWLLGDRRARSCATQRLPRLAGRMLYSDFCSGRINSIVPRSPRGRAPREEGLRVDLLASFGQDRAGAVYVISLTGPVYRLVAR